MIKKIIFLSSFVFALSCGAVFATPTYWTLTDHTTGTDGEITSILTAENAAYESEFGLYMLDDLNNVFRYTLFSITDEPTSIVSVFFDYSGSEWSVSTDKTNWTPFSNVFGFYFGVDTTDSDSDVNYYFYTDSSLNSEDVGIDHIIADFNGTSIVTLYLDDQLSSGADGDFNDMVVVATDVAPVPEPATLLLLGSGLVGLAFIRRKK